MTQNVTVSKVDVVDAGKTKRIVLSYTGSFTKGETWTVGVLAPKLEAQSLAYLKALKSRLDAGGSPESADVLIEKVGGYRTLITAAAVTTAAITSTHTGTSATLKSKTYDDTGVKVGASRNQAIAFLAATRGTKFTLDDVDTIAYEIVTRQAVQEENVRNGVNPTKKSETNIVELLDDIAIEQQYAQAATDEFNF